MSVLYDNVDNEMHSNQFFLSAKSTTDLLPPSDWHMSFCKSAPKYKSTSLDKLADCQSTDINTACKLCCFWKQCSCAVWGVSLNTCYVVYSTCWSGWSYLAPGEKSILVILLGTVWNVIFSVKLVGTAHFTLQSHYFLSKMFVLIFWLKTSFHWLHEH